MQNLNILIIDDKQLLADELLEFFEEHTFHTCTTHRPSQVFSILQAEAIDVVVVNMHLPGMSGLDLLREIKKDYPDINVIVVSGHDAMDAVIQSIHAGAFDFLQNPIRLSEMKAAIERTEKFRQRTQEGQRSHSLISKELQHAIDADIIGRSQAIKNILDMASTAAQHDETNVLILGESGTGKELIARMIHYHSPRSRHRFYAVNCSAIPRELFESELFGHKKGAFTGALESKKGCFQLADGGTLFLDEIGDLPIELQAKLLRVIEDKMVDVVGSENPQKVDVRVIAAANQDLPGKVKKGEFRTDLYYRLNTVVIKPPPLRERQEDIQVLVEHFVRFFAEKMKKPIPTIRRHTLERLQQHAFPGNIRELRNMIERAMIFSKGASLNVTFPEETDEIRLPSNSHKIFDLQRVEKETILAALQESGNNQVKAAILLNISRQALERRIKKYQIVL
ncbi:DNA-binding response regulator [candidate division KSB3 bacterium]|uniref:DNA-binding response regulator n=1 Tax=candidate division KSB3 bacterium TaxID=2044937 RepID=A0A2G6E2I1_9BACT|nr:MAG: DNA-binding response regulator [candidate division KSB3 bacterium]PIE28774.1 MAG: DNA-binding response regulator [candidate division KSB3 bacterium]